MAEDIGIELHDKIKAAFDARCGKDSTLTHIKRKIENGTATMEDTSVYARRLGELLRKSIESTTKPDDLPDGKMYYNIAQSILEPLLRNNYDDVNAICEEVQSALDAKKGIGLKPQKADFPAERVRAAIGGAAVKETAEHAIQVLGRTAENITGSFQTDYIKKNAEFRSKAGLNCYIERKDSHNCCDWCAKLAGRYRYPDEAPKDVYRRHDNCTCDVSYVSEKGRQNVHSKRWANEQAKAQRIAYAASVPKPMKLTRAEAQAKQSEILAQNNKAKAIDIFNFNDLPISSKISPQSIVDELKKTDIGRETLQILNDLPERIKLTYGKIEDLRGIEHNGKIEIYVNQCKNTLWAARTVIHECTHYRYGIGQSQWSECVCIAQELKHARGRNYLTIPEKRAIIKAVKSDSDYAKLNWRKGGFINGRRTSH